MEHEEVFDLIASAFFEGWKAGAEMGPSDSPEWNVGEDWAGSESRKRLITLQQRFFERRET